MKRLYFIILMVLISGSLFAQRFHNQKIIGYVPSYGDGSNVDYSNLTHAFFCFIIPNPDGSLIPFKSWEMPNFNMFLLKSKNAGTKRIVTVGNEIGEVAKDANAIHKFADTIVKFCKYHQLDGLDIDWEMLSTTDEKNSYGQLIDSLAKNLHAAGLVLVATLPINDYWGQWFPDAGVQKADWIQVMAYGLLGSWAASPFGNPASYEDFVAGGDYWEKSRNISRDKIVIGVPFYGSKFSSSSGGLATTITYKDIIVQFPDLSDSVDVTPGTDYDFFNGPVMMRKKCKYLIENNFGGIMIWELTQDAVGDRSLLKQIVCTYNDTQCPYSRTTSVVSPEENLDIKIWTKENDVYLELSKEQDLKFYFYDTLGRLMYETEEYHLAPGDSQIKVPNHLRGNIICRAFSQGQTFSKMIYLQ